MLIFHGKPVHGAIFDMDGTMFDTERLRFQTLQQASQEIIGQEFSHEYLMQCLGLSATTAEQLAQRLYGVNVPYKEIRKKLMRWNSNIFENTAYLSKGFSSGFRAFTKIWFKNGRCDFKP